MKRINRKNVPAKQRSREKGNLIGNCREAITLDNQRSRPAVHKISLRITRCQVHPIRFATSSIGATGVIVGTLETFYAKSRCEGSEYEFRNIDLTPLPAR